MGGGCCKSSSNEHYGESQRAMQTPHILSFTVCRLNEIPAQNSDRQPYLTKCAVQCIWHICSSKSARKLMKSRSVQFRPDCDSMQCSHHYQMSQSTNNWIRQKLTVGRPRMGWRSTEYCRSEFWPILYHLTALNGHQHSSKAFSTAEV